MILNALIHSLNLAIQFELIYPSFIYIHIPNLLTHPSSM